MHQKLLSLGAGAEQATHLHAQVRLTAAAVLLLEDCLPYPVPHESAEQAQALLTQLTALVARAGLPPGHTLCVKTSLVCFRRPVDGAEAKLSAPPFGSWRLEATAEEGGRAVTASAVPMARGIIDGAPATQLEFVGT